MAQPNIVNVTTIHGNTALTAVTTSYANLVANATDSGKVYKVNAIYLNNANTSYALLANVVIMRGGSDYSLANTIAIPYSSTLDLISKSIYLQEGDYIQVSANSSNYIKAICSYEALS